MFRNVAVGGQIMGEKAERGRPCQSVLLVLAVLLNATLAGAGVTVAVTTCGQMVDGRGVLAADLDCSTFQGSAIGVRKGVLELQGFTVIGGANDAVSCVRNCRIVGPGIVEGGARAAVTGSGAVVVVGASIIGGQAAGVDALKRVRLVDTSVSGGGQWAVRGRAVRLTASTVSSSETGIIAGSVKAKDAQISSNSRVGVNATKLRAIATEISANGFDLGCTMAICGDVVTERRPRLGRGSTCERSVDTVNGGTWGVCVDD